MAASFKVYGVDRVDVDGENAGDIAAVLVTYPESKEAIQEAVRAWVSDIETAAAAKDAEAADLVRQIESLTQERDALGTTEQGKEAIKAKRLQDLNAKKAAIEKELADITAEAEAKL